MIPEPLPRETNRAVALGLDVGSTTVKAVVVDAGSRAILWCRYERHHTRQAEKVLELLEAIADQFPCLRPEQTRVFITGSGAGPIAPLLGARFVQEVNAVTLAVERLHPEVGSVVELGGQDAKIILFKTHPQTGARQVVCSMNDKCASGTGATLDKCFIKVGMPAEEVARLNFDAAKLHPVAAKCGVFAETDIVNLVKSGLPANQILCSLADAIVMQNLSVLTRGNTLKPRVLLLGGPNTYLPMMRQCWRLRIPQTWEQRGFEVPRDVPLEELIFVPENAQHYAAFGAVVYGLDEGAGSGLYLGTAALETFIETGRKAQLGEGAGPPLVRSRAEREAFVDTYRPPRFEPATFPAGTVIEGFVGLDGGSTSSKAVVIDRVGGILKKEYQLSKGNPIEDTQQILFRLKHWAEDQGCRLKVLGFGATGYAADVLEQVVAADANIVETVAHKEAAVAFFGDVDVICDIGGQDIKVLFLSGGDIKNFRLSNQCSAGNGMLLQAMADQFGLPVTQYADTAFEAELAPKFSYGCAVFLDTDRVNFQKEGYSKEELLAGLAQVLPKNVWQYVVQIPRLAALGRRFVLQGGTQYNLAAVKAQVDYLRERVPEVEIFVHPHCGEAGALGAAFEAARVVGRRGRSTFIGLEAALALGYRTRRDETTTCHFCPNACARTFIDAERPDGSMARTITGFSCEKGTVESQQAMLQVVAERRELAREFPNLVDYESKQLFRSFYPLEPMPEAGSPTSAVRVKRTIFGGVRHQAYQRGFERSSTAASKRRAEIRIGIPRAMNLYSTAPFFRHYFEALGVAPRNVVFSEFTSEELWQEGGKYGSIDPCYPSKVVQAHFHNLLFHKHQADRPLDCIFFPVLTHVPNFVTDTPDSTACPIVAGVPEVMRAAFTKERDFFADRGIRYLAPALTFAEPTLMKRQLFDTFGPFLEVTEDESDFAWEQGTRALAELDRDLETRGRVILEQVEAEQRIAILLLGRPYHLDPGLHHGIPDEIQALGYPVLTIRSIPKDPAWLERFYARDLERGVIKSPLELGAVWPECYSANSSAKVWAANFAAHHPHVAVLDLSSFKCGHDAPTYGLIDNILSTAGTPASALHDIDANKPGGSIKIRVKTYAHSLKLHAERLEDVARKKAELAHSIEEKRVELLEARRRELAARRVSDLAVEEQLREARLRLEAFRRLSPARPHEPEAQGKLVKIGGWRR